MLVKILGVLDILAAISVFLLKFDVAIVLAWFSVIYLIIKGGLTIKDYASIIDVISGVIIIFTIFFGYNFFSILVILWLGFKGIMSLV